MKSMKERMDILEQQFINLRDSLLSDLKKHFAVDNGNLRMVVDAEGTNNIEEYNTMEIMEDKNKTERLKEDMKDFLDKEVDKLYTRLKDDLVNDLRDQIMVEQEVLFLKMKSELAVKVKKDLDKMKAKVQHELQVNMPENTMQHQQNMLLSMLANYKVNVCSRGTQVEVGELPLEGSSDPIEPMEASLGDSVSLLQGTP